MTDILDKVKKGLGITTDFQDDMLKIYIDDVIAFMVSAGVSQKVATSNMAVGCIIRGVSDLWNYGSGDVKFSQYFLQRIIQLAAETGD